MPVPMACGSPSLTDSPPAGCLWTQDNYQSYLRGDAQQNPEKECVTLYKLHSTLTSSDTRSECYLCSECVGNVFDLRKNNSPTSGSGRSCETLPLGARHLKWRDRSNRIDVD